MSTLVYQWDEIEIEGLIVVKDCPRYGDFSASRVDNCKDCDNFFGFERVAQNDPALWEYKVICRAPLSRSAIKVR